jgi:hypothetical protein
MIIDKGASRSLSYFAESESGLRAVLGDSFNIMGSAG